MKSRCLLTVFSLFFVGVFSQSRLIAFVDAKIIPVPGDTLNHSVLYIQDGKIKQISRDFQISEDCLIVNCAGCVILPGFINTLPGRSNRFEYAEWGITTYLTQRGDEFFLGKIPVGVFVDNEQFSVPNVLISSNSPLVFGICNDYSDVTSLTALNQMFSQSFAISFQISNWMPFKFSEELKFIFSTILFAFDEEFQEEIYLTEYFGQKYDCILSCRKDENAPADLIRHARMLTKFSVGGENILRMMTLAPAKLLGISDKTGSLEVGKNADFIIFSGEPFSTQSVIINTYKKGNILYEFSMD